MVYVCDNLTGTCVTVGDMLSRGEALELANSIKRFQACKVYIVTSEFMR